MWLPSPCRRIGILRNPPKIMIVFFWHIGMLFIEFCNYVTFMRERTVEKAAIVAYRLWDQSLIDAYLAFCVLSVLSYMFVAAPLLLWSYKYSHTERHREVRFKLSIVVMYFTSTTPLFFIEFNCAKQQGLIGTLQASSFILQTLAWLAASIIVWFFYMMEVARFLHQRAGYGRDVTLKKQRMAKEMAAIDGGGDEQGNGGFNEEMTVRGGGNDWLPPSAAGNNDNSMSRRRGSGRGRGGRGGRGRGRIGRGGAVSRGSGTRAVNVTDNEYGAMSPI